jgi:glycosyltransferase involved in cell wall biosynthesis
MPEVSIVMPTFNRADTIGRAIDSVRAQTFADWELIIVDDGSTDGTAAAVSGIDPRIKLQRQENQGCYVARNAGMHNSSGRYITFLDSDDEWLPHFLELTVGFLKASPSDQMVMTEFLEKTGVGAGVRHDFYDVAVKFPRMASQVGSRLMDLPAGETDDYLRVYSSKEPLGAWGRDIAARAGYPDGVLYRGQIFEHLRFGHLGWLPTTMVTREALAKVGDFLPTYRTAADYRFLGLLYRNYRANMIAVPAAIKHSMAVGGQALAEGHLATGTNEYRYAVHRLPLYDEFFWQGRESDPELGKIRGYYHAHAGRVAVEYGKRREAIGHLKEATAANPKLWSVRALRLFLGLVPSDALTSRLYRLFLDATAVSKNLASGRLTPWDFVRKAARRVVRRG